MIHQRSTVAIKRCRDYHPGKVLQSMRDCLDCLGGINQIVRPGQKVLLKPNLLGPFAPDKAVTTHPSVVRAAILLVQEAGGRAFIGDSPGVGSQTHVARICGLSSIVAETGAEWADFHTSREYEVPGFQVSPHLELVRAVAEMDVIISLPKMKTHGQMTFTGALKNQFGLIPGTLKSQWHFRLQQPLWLARLILDIHRAVRPSLAIMDGVVAMEGQGPSAGQPRNLGVLMASSDLVALDTLACHLIGLPSRLVPLLDEARKQDLGATSMEDIGILGEDWRQLQVSDFKKVSALTDLLRIVPLPRGALNWIRDQWIAKPRIDPTICAQCGICEKGCPVNPAAIQPGLLPAPPVNDETCIHCYCCHEFCPHHAIQLRHSWLARSFNYEGVAQKAGKIINRIRQRPNSQ
jgi:uncharacterized protein (DUF362 family)/Pyruvate/2-oxoacid:ferredoxin oxidoreductase delta subunit